MYFFYTRLSSPWKCIQGISWTWKLGKKKRQHRVKEGQKTFKNRANHEYQKTQQNLTEQIEFAIFENCYCFLRWSISINSRIFFVFFSLRYLAHFLIKRFFNTIFFNVLIISKMSLIINKIKINRSWKTDTAQKMNFSIKKFSIKFSFQTKIYLLQW